MLNLFILIMLTLPRKKYVETLLINNINNKTLNSLKTSIRSLEYLGKIKLVDFGVVKRSVLKEFGIKQEVLFADIIWDNVLKLCGNKKIKVSDLPKFPAVKRDLALLLDNDKTFKEIYNLAFQSEKNLLKEVDLFDVYEGDKLPEGKKSYALSFVLQDENKTLEDKQIDKIMQKLQATFEKNLEAVLR